MKNFLRNAFPTGRFYLAVFGLTALFVAGWAYPVALIIAKAALLVFCLLLLTDILLLFRIGNPVTSERIVPERLSNGDENTITTHIRNGFPFRAGFETRDLVPHQFQWRNHVIKKSVDAGKSMVINYSLRPVRRGNYVFGQTHSLVSSPIGLIQRRIVSGTVQHTAVYPSFLQLKKYDLLAFSNRLSLTGIKKVRKKGQQREFDHIRDYVPGDDIRTINWKASARRDKTMVNQFMDERAQQVYSVINMGRTMQMPFREMTLLDYSINAALAFSSVLLKKHDRAGLITFAEKVKTFVPAERRNHQLGLIMENLYKQETTFPEPSHAALYAFLRYKVTQRSLIFLYTNFESVESLEREKPFLIRIARHHRLIVVLFRNEELKQLAEEVTGNSEALYQKVIAQKFMYEKKLIASELNKTGIQTLLTPPEGLTVNVINKYVEIKARSEM